PKMSASWAVFLLCSLLIASQSLGIMSSVAKADADTKYGAVGGLLGRDGVLDGVLGADGVGGLLGRDGAVGTLLDTVLDILIGKDGLLGKDGLVGKLLGGNGGDLTGPKIVKNTLPKINMRSLPGFGHQVGFNTQLLVESTSAPGRVICVQVEADVVMLVQDKWASLQNNKDCKTFYINVHVRPKVPLLDQPLKQFLSDVLSEVGCDIVNTKLNVVSALLGSRIPVLPLGALADLPPFSILSNDALQLDLKLPVGDAESGVVASTQGPPLTATLLLVTGRPPQLSLSQSALGVLLEPVQVQEAFNLSITNSMVRHDTPLYPLALTSPCPVQLTRTFPGSLPLELRVRVAKEPVVAVRGGRATATLKASIDFFSPPLQSSQKPLFSLDMDIVLNIIPSVSDDKLQVSLALDSCFHPNNHCSLLILTRFLPLQVSPLAEWLKQVLEAAYIPAVNDALHVSVPLPNILNTSLNNTKVDITNVRITFPTA
ncbi:BPIB3 protein, partial [Sula dactylatra]|nr:BPIB3 protein [Sula dactylatra]